MSADEGRRNSTMHPAASYTQDQARDVFTATRVFMNGLCDLQMAAIDHRWSSSFKLVVHGLGGDTPQHLKI